MPAQPPSPPRPPLPSQAQPGWTLYDAPDAPAPPANPADRAPTNLPDRYTDLGLIGIGGMGEVRRVRDQELGRVLAMKFIHPQLAQHRGVLARFVEEAQVTAQLQHPGIVPVYDIGHLGDQRTYFTMKEIQGRNLSEVIAEVHQTARMGASETPSGWTFRRLLDAFHKVCEAVAYAHARGVIHRDLKPSNIMVGAFGEVVVADWGLAKVVGLEDSADAAVETIRSSDQALATRAGGVAGTPADMPPEQAAADAGRIGPRSDVYALGGVLYEILSGVPPYDGPSAEAVLAMVLDGPPPPPGRALPSPTRAEADAGSETPMSGGALLVPAELQDLCQRAMARDPDDRFPDAGALAAEIAAWLDGARRREQAQQLTDQAVSMLPEIAGLRREATALRERANRQMEGIQPHEPVERKRRGWALQDEADRLEAQADLKEVELIQLLRAALTYVPDLEAAHRLLAEQYRTRHAAAEAARDRIQSAYYEALLRPHDLGQLTAYLKGEGALTLHTDPPGAEVELCVYERVERRLEAVPMRKLGVTPLQAIPLPRGSYLLRIRAPGRPEVCYPVRIDRGEHWDGVPPGASAPLPIVLPTAAQLGPDDCYVPAGPAWVGGDPEALAPLPRRRVWIDGFVMQRYPVTNQAWVAFLNHLVAHDRATDAQRYAPREGRGSARDEGVQIYVRNAAGRYSIRQDADGHLWGPTWPVAGVDLPSAAAFATWMAGATRRPWRLPSELEWEKAARGADGRFLPWGDFLDPTWTCMADSHAGPPGLGPADAWPMDESPYGVRCLAGNVRTWCADPWSPIGPPLKQGRLLLPDPGGDQSAWRVIRGGSWDAEARACRAASRLRASFARRVLDTGLRVVRSFPETG